jgi:hypothetical protein
VDTGTDIFLNILGRLPNFGEQVTLLNTASQTDTTSTYLGSGNWDNIPVLGVGQAAFLKVEPAPEPGVFSIFIVGIIFIYWRMKRLNRSLKPTAVGAAVASHVTSQQWHKWGRK